MMDLDLIQNFAKSPCGFVSTGLNKAKSGTATPDSELGIW